MFCGMIPECLEVCRWCDCWDQCLGNSESTLPGVCGGSAAIALGVLDMRQVLS